MILKNSVVRKSEIIIPHECCREGGGGSFGLSSLDVGALDYPFEPKWDVLVALLHQKHWMLMFCNYRMMH